LSSSISSSAVVLAGSHNANGEIRLLSASIPELPIRWLHTCAMGAVQRPCSQVGTATRAHGEACMYQCTFAFGVQPCTSLHWWLSWCGDPRFKSWAVKCGVDNNDTYVHPLPAQGLGVSLDHLVSNFCPGFPIFGHGTTDKPLLHRHCVISEDRGERGGWFPRKGTQGGWAPRGSVKQAVIAGSEKGI
jgi:hypothetical protein